MGDEKDGAKAVKPPKTTKGIPQDLADFLDCKSDKVELKPGKQAWLGGIPTVGDMLAGANITFDSKADGSIGVTAKLGEGALSTSMSVKLKVDAAGHLSIDPSDSMMLNAFKDNINEWTDGLNKWFDSKGKKLGKPKVRRGVVTLTKDKTIAMNTGPPGVKTGGLWPNVPVGEKVAAGGVLALATIGAFALLPQDTTATRQVTTFAEVPITTPVSPPKDDPVKAPSALELSQRAWDACWALDHKPGEYTDILGYFTTSPRYDGTWTVDFARSPSGRLRGKATVENGRGSFDIRISQFGTYGRLTFRIPGTDGAVPPGAFRPILPLVVTEDPLSCDPDSLETPPTRETEQSSDPNEPAPLGTEQQPVVQTLEVTKDGGPPWSLLLIPGTAAVVGGGLSLDERRRTTKRST
jgi:hypothetical protein